MPKLIAAILLISGVAVATATSSSASPAPRAVAAADKDIVETAAAAGDFTTLVALVEKAGLADALSGDELTVFAPTDEAFGKVPEATLEKLGRKPRMLRRVLRYHVVAGDLKAADVVERRSLRTLAGARIKVRVRDGEVRLNRSAKVVQADVAASNGTIHVIDRVLMPPRRR